MMLTNNQITELEHHLGNGLMIEALARRDGVNLDCYHMRRHLDMIRLGKVYEERCWSDACDLLAQACKTCKPVYIEQAGRMLRAIHDNIKITEN